MDQRVRRHRQDAQCEFAFRELLNFLLEPLAKIDDWLMPLDSTSGALIVYEKV